MSGKLELFRYCVLRHPSDAEAKEGRKTELVIPPTEYALYPSQQAVLIAAWRALPPEALEDTDRYEVAVSPF